MIQLATWRMRHFGRSLREAFGAWRRRQAAWHRYWRSFHDYQRLAGTKEEINLHYLYPCLNEDTPQTEIEPTYFYQDAWAFERIVAANPEWHVDVGSHHKYVALLSKVVPLTMVDIRPLALPMDSIRFVEGSLLDLPFASRSVPSVSSLCVVEHVGLGRYGDPLDPDGSEKAIDELKRVVQPGGDLYLSVPLHNTNRSYFNAHRAFTETHLLERFEPFETIDRHYIYGSEYVAERRPGFGTGCYHLRRPDHD